MENQELEKIDTENQDMWRAMEKSHRRGKVMGGLLIVSIGSLFLARELGAEIPTWVFSWKMLLIGLGVVAAVKHKMMHPAWIILIGIGGSFLLNDFYPDMNIKAIVWPVLAIFLGLFIIFKPRRKFRHGMHRHWRAHHMKHREYWEKKYGRHQGWVQDCEGKEDYNCNGDNKEDLIESTVVMAGVKKNIISKTFKGGEVTNVFGGTELNLMQADIEGTASLEITQVFGGTKLVVPANWEIMSELMVTVVGSVEDKRPTPANVDLENRKILRLTGTTVFGGIEIRSY